mmetsp:Transcript_29407/g.44419  ORF Transcript_29407/g.44419 Transcript_29407/m.44419 type:complete len:482 (+) Transcript_29407:55-1500(+)
MAETPSSTKLTKVVVAMLPFQLQLDISSDDRRLEEDALGERRQLDDVDLADLKSRMAGYLNDVFVESLEGSSVVYSPFSTTVLTLTAYATDFGTRRSLGYLGEEGMVDMDEEDFDWKVLEEVDIDTILAQYDEDPPPHKDNVDLDMQNERKTAESQRITATFNSVAIFTKDGDLPIPDSNQVAAIQISSFQEAQSSRMLAALQGPGDNPNDLLTFATAAAATVTLKETPMFNSSIPTGGTRGLDTVILIAVIVAAMSLCLLVIGIVIAWRRKLTSQRHYLSHNHNHHYNSSAPKSSDAMPTTVKQRQAEQAPPRHLAPPSEDFSVSDLGTTTTGVDHLPVMDPHGSQVIPGISDNQRIVPNPPALGGGVRGKFRSFTKKNAARTNNASNQPTSNTANPTGEPTSGIYPEAVVSDDISSSLQDYYRSGLASHGNASTIGGNSTAGGRRVIPGSDVSVSSMESYGYSLDGYVSSVAQSTQYGY